MNMLVSNVSSVSVVSVIPRGWYVSLVSGVSGILRFPVFFKKIMQANYEVFCIFIFSSSVNYNVSCRYNGTLVGLLMILYRKQTKSLKVLVSHISLEFLSNPLGVCFSCFWCFWHSEVSCVF